MDIFCFVGMTLGSRRKRSGGNVDAVPTKKFDSGPLGSVGKEKPKPKSTPRKPPTVEGK